MEGTTETRDEQDPQIGRLTPPPDLEPEYEMWGVMTEEEDPQIDGWKTPPDLEPEDEMLSVVEDRESRALGRYHSATSFTEMSSEGFKSVKSEWEAVDVCKECEECKRDVEWQDKLIIILSVVFLVLLTFDGTLMGFLIECLTKEFKPVTPGPVNITTSPVPTLSPYVFNGRECPNGTRNNTTLPSGRPALVDDDQWIVFQRRVSATLDFNRSWADYAEGFGNVSVTSNYWLGLEDIHQMCNETHKCELRIGVKYEEKPFRVGEYDECYVAEYSLFWIGDVTTNYTLTLAGYNGTAGDSLTNTNWRRRYQLNHRPFTTFDRDHDGWALSNCAFSLHGPWWHNWCTQANLNGCWSCRDGTGAYWRTVTDYMPVLYSEMSVRPKT